MMTEVFDSWSAYDYPVLVAIARRAEQSIAYMDVMTDNILDEVSTSPDDRYKFERAIVRLDKNGYIEALSVAWGQPYPMRVLGITERGLRAAGAWPNPENVVKAILERLEQRANELAISAPEKSAGLKNAVGFLAGAGREVLVNVVTGVVSRLAGLP
ncbi:MAG TPA: hypothetical protein VIO62_12285 [Candidatus Dormibacteraeota bacterium]|jgi:hypothetical protein